MASSDGGRRKTSFSSPFIFNGLSTIENGDPSMDRGETTLSAASSFPLYTKSALTMTVIEGISFARVYTFDFPPIGFFSFGGLYYAET